MCCRLDNTLTSLSTCGKKTNSMITPFFHISFSEKSFGSAPQAAHLHAVILGDSSDEDFLHCIVLSIQFVHDLQDVTTHIMTVLNDLSYTPFQGTCLKGYRDGKVQTLKTFPYDPLPSLHNSSNSLMYRDVCASNSPSFSL